MSQVKKFQDGTSAGGIKPSKVKFKINGNDYEKDEQFVKDQFEPMFNELVQNGNAKERDRDLWRNSFQQYLGQAKTGTYSIESSAGKFLSGTYQGTGDAQLGLDENGNSARKSQVGELISRRSKNDEQRMSLINNVLGSKLAGAYTADQEAATLKQKTEADKLAADAKASALKKFKALNSGYGSTRYGADYDNDPTFATTNYWDKKTTDKERLTHLSETFSGKLKELFNPEFDKYKDDINKELGIDLEARRLQASKLFDPTTGSFRNAPKYLKDFSAVSNVFDTMKIDAPFYSLKDFAGNPNAQPATTAGSTATSTAPTIKPVGRAFTDNKLFYEDKEGTKLINGWKDGIRYEKGMPYTGYGLGPTNEYIDDLTGTYLNGKIVPKADYDKHYESLAANPETMGLTKELDDKRNGVMQIYDKNYGQGRFVDFKSIKDTDGSDFLLKALAGKKNITHAVNATEAIPGLSERGGALAQVKDDNDKDHLGMGRVYNVLKLPNGHTVIGKIRENKADGSLRLYYNDNSGKYYNNPEVNNLLKNLKLNGKIKDQADNFRFTPKGGNTSAPTERRSGMMGVWKHGGKINKHQIGGSMYASNINSNATRTQNTLGGITKAVTDSNYNMSNLDKMELAALGGDLAGVVMSMTGAGSAPAGIVGIGSTLAQGYVDMKRDGPDWGDAGRLATGLALDAASLIPGLGMVGKGTKTMRTLTKVAKWAVPAMAAAGMANGAKTLLDVSLGKKQMSDLSVDELRGIVNGIHGLMGTTRAVGQRLATKNVEETSIRLKDGKPVTLTTAEARSIEGADDKVAAAKALIAKKKGVDVADIQLAEKTGLKLRGKGWTKKEEIVDINTNSTGKTLKDADQYQGEGLWNSYMRGAIKKAGVRDPSLISSDEPDRRFGLLGDYFRGENKLKGAASIVPEQTKALPMPSGQPEMGVFPNRIAQEGTRRGVLQDDTDVEKLRADQKYGKVLRSLTKARDAKKAKRARLQEQNAAAEVSPLGQTKIKFQKGGSIPQYLARLPEKKPWEWTMPESSLEGVPAMNKIQLTSLNPTNKIGLQLPKPTVTQLGNQRNVAGPNIMGKVLEFTKTIDPNIASELGRALHVRNLNSKLDTRVERPMIDTPAEVSVPVRGNLLAKNAYDRQANNIMTQANNVPTSDGMLATAASLSGASQAADIRAKGDLVNVEALERSRAASLENQMRGAQIRNQVATQNVQTNARATQAERAANNEKFSRMNQPIVDFWKDLNYKNSVKAAQDKQIDTQIALQGKAGVQNNLLNPLMQKMNMNQSKLMQPNLTPEEIKRLNDENALYDRQGQWIQQQGLLDQLQTRKNIRYQTPSDWYTKGLPTMKSGGSMTATAANNEAKVAVQNSKESGNNSRATVKAHGEMISDGLQDETKRSIAAMKEIQDLIKLALS